MKSLWKISNFPDNGSGEKKLSKTEIEATKQAVQKLETEISSIKQEMKQEMKQEAKQNLIFDESSKNSVQSESEAGSIKLLGELLVTLRKSRSMSLLMLCRQISQIELDGKTAVIFSEDKDIVDIQNNERYYAEISKFFESKGLSFKVQEVVEDKTEIDELKRLLGRKLIIKEKSSKY